MVTREITCPTCNSKLEVKSRFAHLELAKHNVKVHKTTPAKTPAKKAVAKRAVAKRAVAKKATPRRRAQHKPTLAPQG